MFAHRFSVAPMMERTDRHFRQIARAVSRHALLYTEMVTGRAVLEGRAERDLAFEPNELPLALQVGDNDPKRLAHCAALAQARGFTEIDLNVGCPSSAVRSGAFGARLMLDPPRVAECVAAMKGATSIPVTVKHRIGVDDVDRYEDMLSFVDTVSQAGADGFIVHARKAWLSGLSPKQNRNVPPLRWPEVQRLARERGQLRVEGNGGVASTQEVLDALDQDVQGVMVGRAIYRDPLAFLDVDARVFESREPPPTAKSVLDAVVEHAHQWVEGGGRLHEVTRHVHGLFLGRPGGRAARRTIAEAGSSIGLPTLHAAIAHVA